MSNDLTPTFEQTGRQPWGTMEVGDYFIGPTILQTQIWRRARIYGRKYVSVSVSGSEVKITRMPDDFVKRSVRTVQSTELQELQEPQEPQELDTMTVIHGNYKVVYPWATMKVGERFRINVKSKALVHVARKQHNIKLRTEDIPLTKDQNADLSLPRFVWVIRMPDDYVPTPGNPNTNGYYANTRSQPIPLEWRSTYGMLKASTPEPNSLTFNVLNGSWSVSPDYKDNPCSSKAQGKAAAEAYWKHYQQQATTATTATTTTTNQGEAK